MPYDGVAGAHLFTATVSGAGSVSAAVAVEGSNDLIGWASIVTLSPSGSGSAVASASTGNSYRYVRANVSAVTGQLIVKMASETVEADTAVPPGMKPVYATPSDGRIAFDEPTTAAIIAIAGDASSGSAAQIVDGYPVEVTDTSEVLVSAVPCDVVWIAHNGAAGTITLRDAATTGSGLAAAKTVDMVATPTMQAGGLRTQYGLSTVLTAGKATFWVRPL